MNQNFEHRKACSIGVALLLVLSLARCGLLQQNCCGYKGPVVSPASVSLYAKDHFIPKSMIDDWTARYEANQSLLQKSNLRVGINLPSASCSFSGRFVRSLLCDKNSIGIRVLCGLDSNLAVHLILVGIKPDYSTLYIPRPGFSKMGSAFWVTNSTEVGGLQFSQKP